MAFGTFGSLMVRILLMVAVGYFIKKRGILDDPFQSKLSGLLIKIVLPLNILAAGNTAYSAELGLGLVQTALLAGGYYVVMLAVMLLLTRGLGMAGNKKCLLITMVVFANTAFIGFPLVEELFGAEGYMYAVVYNLAFQLFLSTAGIWLMSGGEKLNLKGFVTSPLTVAPVLAIVLFLLPIRLPDMVAGAMEQIGSMMVPLSMLIIGGQLASIKFISVWQDKWSYLVSALRLLVLPLLMLLVCRLFGIGGIVGGVCVVLTAISPASLNVILAEQYGQDTQFATRTVVQSMILMVGTLPLVLLCLSLLPR